MASAGTPYRLVPAHFYPCARPMSNDFVHVSCYPWSWLEHSNSGKKVSIRFSLPKFFRFDSIRQSDKFAARFYTDIKIVMMVSLVKGLAASLYAVVHSVPYQYQLDNFQQVKNV